MDRFKFRVWIGSKMIDDIIGRTDMEMYWWDDNIPKMQCTGLKDKNGKLIYEGDIVDWEDGRGSVFWDKDGAWVHGYAEKPDFIWHRPPKRMWSKVEVIGNVHENIKLLEEDNAK